jgi:hypothetical protein
VVSAAETRQSRCRFRRGGASEVGGGRDFNVYYHSVRSAVCVYAGLPPEWSTASACSCRRVARNRGHANSTSHKVGSRADRYLGCAPESADSQTTSCCVSNAQSTALGRATDDMSDSVMSTIAAAQPSLESWPLPSLQLQCPNCRKGPCRISSTAQTACLSCRFTFSETNGVYNALPQSREAKYSQFVHDYELVRSKEGRGSDRSDYYLALPFQDLTGRNAWQWGIRARTFRFMERKLLPLVEGKSHRRCDV